jgi:hypothetical protein
VLAVNWKARSGRLFFDFSLVVLLLVAAFMSFSYAPDARAIPLATSIVAMVFVLIQIVIDIKGSVREAEHPGGGGDGESIGYRRPLMIFIYLAGFVFLLWWMGYLFAVPISAFALMRLAGRVPWVTAVGVAAGLWLFVYVVFEVMLEANL